MSKNTKIWLVVAASLVIIGGIIFAGVMTMLEWDFTKLSTAKYETNNYEINEDYKNISVVTKTANIVLVPCEDSETSVLCHERENERHSVEVKDGTLVIKLVDTRKWYEYIGVNFGAPKITVYIPKGEHGEFSVRSSTGDVEIPENFKFESIDMCQSTGDVTCRADASGDIKIKTSTGDIRVENVSAGEIDLSVTTGRITVSDSKSEGEFAIRVSTGKTYLTDVTCKNLVSKGNTGDISLNRVIASEKLLVERSTGDVKFEKCDGAEISVKTDTGSVKGSLLSEKIFIAETSTGKINVPKTTSGGRCEIKTSTGDIKLTVD